jgi:hypothetical protein
MNTRVVFNQVLGTGRRSISSSNEGILQNLKKLYKDHVFVK